MHLHSGQKDIALLIPPAIALLTVPFRAYNSRHYCHQTKPDGYAPLLASEEELTRSGDEENQNAYGTKAILKSDGLEVFSLRLTRLLCVFALLSLSVGEVVVNVGKSGFAIRVALFAFYIYVQVLSGISIVSKSKYWRGAASRDASFSLFVAFLVYFMRDVWPYAIAYPMQTHTHNWVTWTRMVSLALSGALIPLAIPEPHRNSITEMNEAGTYSLFSRITFNFMNSVIFFAYRKPDLKVDDLPPIPLSHRADVLAKHALPKLDPLVVGKRHIVWGLLSAFTADYTYMCFWTFLMAISKYIGPYAMKVLLTSLETSDVPSHLPSTQTGYANIAMQVVLKTWVWIAVIALAPMLSSAFENRHLYNSTLVQVKEENLLSLLVFEHALRMRVKSDFGDSKDAKSKSIPDITVTQTTTLVEPPSSSVQADGAAALEVTEDIVSGVQNSDGLPSEESPPDSTEYSSNMAQSDTQLANSKDNSEASKKVPTAAKVQTGENKTNSKKNAPILGKINNLLTSDMRQVITAQIVLHLPSAAIQAGLGIVFLYGILGWSALVGLAVFIITSPVPAILGKMLIGAQRTKMNSTDQRVQSVTETVQILRTLKLLAWESLTLKQLSEKRRTELKWVLRGKLLDFCLRSVQTTMPLWSLLATFGTYTLVQKEPLTAARAFPALSVFTILEEQIFIIMFRIPRLLRSKVSFDRFNEFLHDTEMLVPTPITKLTTGTGSDSDSNDLIVHPAQDDDRLGCCNASFSWTESLERPGDSRASQLSLSNRFELRLDNEVLFKKGKTNLIVGPTASGKTSLLMALLGEMYYIPHGTTSWYNLPRKGGIAYAPQESWVINATIKDNIIFNQSFDEVRYRKILKQCSLERDLSLWEAGDMTEVGEKGLTLSGGQKARVTLARALYSSASIVLLDDPLAALDVHTAKDVVRNALRGEFVQDRTIILVTHNIPLAAPLADHVIALGKDGRIIGQGSINDVLKMDDELGALANQVQATIENDEILGETAKDDVKSKDKVEAGKLMVAEEKAIGHIEWAAIKLFVEGVGGVFTWTIILSLGIFWIATYVGQTWAIGYWASQYDKRPASEVSALLYLGLYAAVVLTGALSEFAGDVFWVYRSMRASRIIYDKLMRSILNAPLRWLDVVPVGRILTRCTQDIDAVDGTIADYFNGFVIFTMQILALLSTTVVMTGWPALVSGAITAVTGGWLGLVYLKAQLSVKREWSNAKSPIVSQVGTAVSGIVTIRAYGAQAYFREELSKRLDTYSRVGRSYCDLNRWIAVRIDILGGIFAAVVASYLVYGHQVNPSAVGFTLSVTLAFCRQILTWVRVYNMLEVECNSLERILDFLRIDQEPQPVESGKPPAYWPASGNLRVEKLSASYSDDGPLILRDVTFDIKSGERVGIVGRTGAGKSSITLALLRAIKTTGKVYYDGLATDTMNLDALRSNITLIPQQPELIRGTLRENLDPFEHYDDATLNDSLRSAGLFDIGEEEPTRDNLSDGVTSTVTQEGAAAVGLDTAVDSGGTNLSLGQRQIIALARAILRRSKILILDEATAAIDYKTDAAIQKSLRTEFSQDTTVITVAHRLQTIMDSDKILVLDAGQVAEFDTPANLLKNKDGFLRGLVDASDDKNRLLAMAGVQPEEL